MTKQLYIQTLKIVSIHESATESINTEDEYIQNLVNEYTNEKYGLKDMFQINSIKYQVEEEKSNVEEEKSNVEEAEEEEIENIKNENTIYDYYLNKMQEDKNTNENTNKRRRNKKQEKKKKLVEEKRIFELAQEKDENHEEMKKQTLQMFENHAIYTFTGHVHGLKNNGFYNLTLTNNNTPIYVDNKFAFKFDIKHGEYLDVKAYNNGNECDVRYINDSSIVSVFCFEEDNDKYYSNIEKIEEDSEHVYYSALDEDIYKQASNYINKWKQNTNEEIFNLNEKKNQKLHYLTNKVKNKKSSNYKNLWKQNKNEINEINQKLVETHDDMSKKMFGDIYNIIEQEDNDETKEKLKNKINNKQSLNYLNLWKQNKDEKEYLNLNKKMDDIFNAYEKNVNLSVEKENKKMDDIFNAYDKNFNLSVEKENQISNESIKIEEKKSNVEEEKKSIEEEEISIINKIDDFESICDTINETYEELNESFSNIDDYPNFNYEAAKQYRNKNIYERIDHFDKNMNNLFKKQ